MPYCPPELLYDIRDLRNLLPGVELVALLFAAAALYGIVRWSRNTLWGNRAASRIVAAVLLSVFLCAFGYLQWKRFWLRGVVMRGEAASVEGVATLHPYVVCKAERLTVADKTFEYSAYDAGPGFRAMSCQGGPIATGDKLKVYYVDKDIVLIERTPAACPKTEPSSTGH
jgi:hypothetical protein